MSTADVMLRTTAASGPSGPPRGSVASGGTSLSLLALGAIDNGGWTANVAGPLSQGWSGRDRAGVAAISESLLNFVAPTISAST
ncbi:UNVERIFIED_ORG: hypothetical protein ABIB19_003335 [Arthrobacter sp. UYEF10]